MFPSSPEAVAASVVDKRSEDLVGERNTVCFNALQATVPSHCRRESRSSLTLSMVRESPEGAPCKYSEETHSEGFAPIETAHRHQWGRLLACRARTCQVAERTIVGVMKINSSCLETFSVLFLNSHPRTGMRDR